MRPTRPTTVMLIIPSQKSCESLCMLRCALWRGPTPTLSWCWDVVGQHQPPVHSVSPSGTFWLMGECTASLLSSLSTGRHFLTFSFLFRCPYQDDRYLTTLVPVTGSSGLQFPSHYKRFVVKMFTFVDSASLAPLQETVCPPVLEHFNFTTYGFCDLLLFLPCQIFIHCSTEVCHPSSGSCEQSCTRKREFLL